MAARLEKGGMSMQSKSGEKSDSAYPWGRIHDFLRQEQ